MFYEIRTGSYLKGRHLLCVLLLWCCTVDNNSKMTVQEIRKSFSFVLKTISDIFFIQMPRAVSLCPTYMKFAIGRNISGRVFWKAVQQHCICSMNNSKIVLKFSPLKFLCIIWHKLIKMPYYRLFQKREKDVVVGWLWCRHKNLLFRWLISKFPGSSALYLQWQTSCRSFFRNDCFYGTCFLSLGLLRSPFPTSWIPASTSLLVFFISGLSFLEIWYTTTTISKIL